MTEFKANKLELDAQKNWDLFFKDRHWTTREFEELLGEVDSEEEGKKQNVLLEFGCGVGSLVFPLLEENLPMLSMFTAVTFHHTVCRL